MMRLYKMVGESSVYTHCSPHIHPLSQTNTDPIEMFATLTSAFVLALAGTSAVAKPIARQSTPEQWCSLLTSANDGFGTLSDFTLAAYNASGDRDTGLPLAVGGHSTGQGAIFAVLQVCALTICCYEYSAQYILQVWESTSPSPFPTLSLVDSALTATGPDGTAVSIDISEGSEILFFTEPTGSNEVPPAQIWCGLVSVFKEIHFRK